MTEMNKCNKTNKNYKNHAKRKFMAAAVCAGIILSGCGKQAEEIPNVTAGVEENTTEGTSGAAVGTNAQDSSAETSAVRPEQEQKPVYYGTWKVEAKVGTTPISALSQEETDELVGTILTYEADSFTWNESRCGDPEYQENSLTAAEFQEDYRLAFADLGITADTVRSVTVENSDFFGSHFLIRNDDTLIVFYEGVFFNLVSEDFPASSGVEWNRQKQI